MRWARTKWSQHGWAKWIGYLVMVFHPFSTLFGWVIGPTLSMMRYQELSIRNTWNFGYFQLPTQLNNMVVNSLWHYGVFSLQIVISSAANLVPSSAKDQQPRTTASLEVSRGVLPLLNTRQKKGGSLAVERAKELAIWWNLCSPTGKKTSTVLIPQPQWLRSSPHPILKPWPNGHPAAKARDLILWYQGGHRPLDPILPGPMLVVKYSETSDPKATKSKSAKISLRISQSNWKWFIVFLLSRISWLFFLTIWMSLSISNECHRGSQSSVASICTRRFCRWPSCRLKKKLCHKPAIFGWFFAPIWGKLWIVMVHFFVFMALYFRFSHTHWGNVQLEKVGCPSHPVSAFAPLTRVLTPETALQIIKFFVFPTLAELHARDIEAEIKNLSCPWMHPANLFGHTIYHEILVNRLSIYSCFFPRR